MAREIGIGLDLGYIADVALYEGTGVIEGASVNSVKLPTADGQRIKGVVMYDVEAGKQVNLRKAGIAKLRTSGAITDGDELIVTATTGYFKTQDTVLGETHHVAAIAEEASGSSDIWCFGKVVDESKIVLPLVVNTADPGATDDSYDVGTLWFNSTDGSLFQCTDNTDDTAVWNEISDPSGVLGGEVHSSASDPTTDNDGVDTAALGKTFSIGAIWINTTNDSFHIAVDVSTGAAVWLEVIDNSIVRAGETYNSADADPTVNNDGADTATLGKKFAVGAFWTNATDDSLFVCLDVSTGAAVWLEVIDNSIVRAGEVYVAAAADPGVNNDGVDTAALGKKFAPGAMWINQTDAGVFIAITVATGAADWDEFTTT
jgi:hypothetical protein